MHAQLKSKPCDCSPQSIVLVHGTFAQSDEDKGSSWYQTGGKLRGFLDDKLHGVAVCDSVFHWSGDNSERSREIAARKLLHRLQELENQRKPFHLIGHSHGGSVIWRTLQLSMSNPFSMLRSWTTLGAPFIHYGLDLSRLWFLLPFTSTATLCFISMQQIPALWEVRREIWGTEPWPVAAAASVLFILLLMLVLVSVPLVQLLAGGFRLWRQSSLANRAWGKYSHLHRMVCSREDEALRGLQSSLTLHHQILERDSKSRNPVTKVLQWIWNHLIGRPVDVFVWRLVRSLAQGVDHGPYVVTAVTATPQNNSPVFKGLKKELEQELTEAADLSFGSKGRALRPALAAAALSPESLVTLQNELADVSLDFLIHCQYTEHPLIWERTESWVRSAVGGNQPTSNTNLIWRPPRAPAWKSDAVIASFWCTAIAFLSFGMIYLLHPGLAKYTLAEVNRQAFLVADALPIDKSRWENAQDAQFDFFRKVLRANYPDYVEQRVSSIANARSRADFWLEFVQWSKTNRPELTMSLLKHAIRDALDSRTLIAEEDWFRVEVGLLEQLAAHSRQSLDPDLQQLQTRLLDVLEEDISRSQLPPPQNFFAIVMPLTTQAKTEVDRAPQKERVRRLLEKAVQSLPADEPATFDATYTLSYISFAAATWGDYDLAESMAERTRGQLNQLTDAQQRGAILRSLANSYRLCGDIAKSDELNTVAQKESDSLPLTMREDIAKTSL